MESEKPGKKRARKRERTERAEVGINEFGRYGDVGDEAWSGTHDIESRLEGGGPARWGRKDKRTTENQEAKGVGKPKKREQKLERGNRRKNRISSPLSHEGHDSSHSTFDQL